MYGSGEDRISNLPDGVVGDILSRLPTKDAVRTSILSKDWEYKWTSVSNIKLDDRDTSLRGNMRHTIFVSFVERVLHLTQNSRIKSFRLSCSTKLDSQYLKTCITGILMRGVQNLEIKTYQCKFDPLKKDLYNYRSLTELRLEMLYCNVPISLIKNCFPNLKILHFGNGVHLWGNKISYTSQVILFDLPVLEDLELRCCVWRVVKSVEINAPALIRLVAEGKARRVPNDFLIKIDAPKLEKFESHGLLDNYVIAAPSISNAVLSAWEGGTTLGFRAHAILKGFLSLNYLKLSSEIVHAFIESNLDFSLPCFNRLKQLEFESYLYDDVSLWKLLQVMRSLESLSLEMYEDGLNFFPSGMASRLKVVELVGFRGTKSQNEFAKSVLKNAHNLETLFVFVGDSPLMKRKEIIKHLFSTSPKSSPRVTVMVNGPRKRKEN